MRLNADQKKGPNLNIFLTTFVYMNIKNPHGFR